MIVQSGAAGRQMTLQGIYAPGLLVAQEQLLVVFDGECGLCNRAVRWLLRRDRDDRLRFAPSTHPALASVLTRSALAPLTAQTILVLRHPERADAEFLYRSDAILACLRLLPEPWPMLAALAGYVPRAVRDAGYRVIARWRYRIWGRYASCPIPTAEERKRFLD